MDKLWNLFHNKAPESKKSAELMTASKVDFNFRIYWTKMMLKYPAEKRIEARSKAQAIIQQADFEDNLIEKRYHLPLEGIPEVTHSGASLLALIEVLNALDRME